MLNLKGCPRCQGALYLAADMYGRYVNCLQCGFTRDLPSPQASTAKAGAAKAGAAKPVYQPVERKAA